MSAEQVARVDWIRREAKKALGGDRRPLVESMAGGDVMVFATVMGHLRRDGLLPNNVLAVLPELIMHYASASKQKSPARAIGIERVIGPFRLLRAIGRGRGFDRFEAALVEPELCRVEAVVLDPGPDGVAAMERFGALRERLEAARHPALSKTYDASVTLDDRVAFFTDPMRGEPIDRFCDANGLTIAERVELIAQAADAVAEAHLQGVVFRDLCPDTVRAWHDTDGAVRVSVWGAGIAASLDARLIETNKHAVDTLPRQYIAPEVAADNGAPIDGRADVFGLGAVAFSVIVGEPPRGEQSVYDPPLAEAQQRIRHESAPLASDLVSYRLGSAGDLDTGMRYLKTRRTDAQSLRRLLKSDLDYVLAKAIETNRAARYRDAGGFAADLRRVLANEPVRARPPEPLYVMAKLAARRPRRALVAGIGCAAVFAGFVASFGAAVQARVELIEGRERIAQLESTVTHAEASRPAPVEAAPVISAHERRDMQLGAAARAALGSDTIEDEASLLASIADIVGAPADSEGARRLRERALKLAEGSGVAGAQSTIDVRFALCEQMLAGGDAAEALAACGELVERCERGFGRADPRTVRAWILLGRAQSRAGEPADSLPWFSRASKQAVLIDGAASELAIEAVRAEVRVLVEAGQTAAAVRSAQTLVSAAEIERGRDAIAAHAARLILGEALTAAGRFTDAEHPLWSAYDAFERESGADAPESKRARAALIALHEAWDAAEPGIGHAAEAERLRAGID